MSLSITLPTSSTQTFVDPPKGERRPLLTPLSEPGHFLLVLDNTSLDKWKRCPIAARNYLVFRREGHVKGNALVFGGALHEGLDRFHNELFHNGIDAARSNSPAAAQDIAISSYFRNHPHDTADYRTVDRALQVMSAYRQRAASPDYALEILSDDEGPLIERPFELPLGQIKVGAVIDCPSWKWENYFRPGGLVNNTLEGQIQQWYNSHDIREQLVRAHQRGVQHPVFVDTVHVAWSGKIDLVCRIFGTTYILDHKTSSISGDGFIQSFQLASQTMGYTWASRQLWPDFNILNFCLNAIYFRKPTVGCTDITLRGPRGGEPPLSFARHFFNYTEPRLLEWQNDTLAHIEDFLHCLVRDHFPSNDKQCFDKYGECPYHTACVEPNPTLRLAFLNSPAFRDVTWNPTEKTTQ